MRPIVDGLEAEYDTLDFFYLNAQDGGAGERAFDAYNLRGHPTVLLVDESGEVLWEGIGIREHSELAQQIELVTRGTP